MSPYVFLGLAILSEVIGTTALKASDGFRQPLPSVVVVIAYGAAFFFLSQALRTFPIGVAYAIWSGAGTAMIAVLGIFVFQEKLSWQSALGIGLIIAGVVILNLVTEAHST